MMTTIRDIAKRANVSVGTVSNVLNNYVGVKEETRRKVLDAIEALDYHPNAAARTLNTQRTNTIGFIRIATPGKNRRFDADPFVFDLIEGLANAAAEQQYGLTYWAAPPGAAQMELYRAATTERRVDGLIVLGLSHNDPRINYLREQSFPFVAFGRPDPLTFNTWVDVDCEHGFGTVVQYLAGLGHTRIGYLAPPNNMILTQHRWLSFSNAMDAVGLRINGHLVYGGDFSEQSGQLGTHHLLDFPQPPTAILCGNDRMAIGAMRAVQARGLVVGRDVSVVGFDDISLASYTSPLLTTLRQPTLEISKLLFERVLRVINDEEGTNDSGVLIKPELVIRQSTGPVP